MSTAGVLMPCAQNASFPAFLSVPVAPKKSHKDHFCQEAMPICIGLKKDHRVGLFLIFLQAQFH